MTTETLERLLNEACELLIIFEDGNIATDDDKARISAIFSEIRYSDELDYDMKADAEAQDWDKFKENKI
jgi:hypothetical protein